MARKKRRTRRLTLPPKQKSALSKARKQSVVEDSVESDPYYSTWEQLKPVGHFKIRHQVFRKDDRWVVQPFPDWAGWSDRYRSAQVF